VTAVQVVTTVARGVVDRLTFGHDWHGQRWRLQLPCEGDPLGQSRPLLILLGLPTLGLAFAISVLTTYGPVVLIHLTDSTSQVGALIGGEGAFALLVPLIAGTVSDRLPGSAPTRRLPFVVAGAPLVVLGLLLLALGGSVPLAAASVLAFFVGYYLYYPPYRALYADLLPRGLQARAQATQAVLRGVGLGVALLAGGLLLSVWQPLPFMIAAATVIGTTLALAPIIRLENRCPNPVLPYEAVSIGGLFRSGQLRAFAVANGLWEFSFSGLKRFIVLYVVRGLGQPASVASGVIAVVAVAYIVGAPLASRLADRHGIVPVIRVTALVYGTGLVVGGFLHDLTPMLIGLPIVAVAGSIVMTLPPALAFTIAPAGSEGAVSGLLDFSRGLGVVLGPVAVGIAIDLFRGQLTATHGYAAMWPVIGIPVLASLIFLRALERTGAARPGLSMRAET
jgi:MFS family permease